MSTAGTAEVNTNTITLTTTTSPALKAAVVPALESVTQQAIFHTGSNHDGVAKFVWMNVGKGGGADPIVDIRGLVYNRQFNIYYTIFKAQIDTSSELSISLTDPIGFNLSPTDVLFFEANTNTNNAEISLRFSLNEYQRS